jgi:hypothetical protein
MDVQLLEQVDCATPIINSLAYAALCTEQETNDTTRQNYVTYKSKAGGGHLMNAELDQLSKTLPHKVSGWHADKRHQQCRKGNILAAHSRFAGILV